MTQDEAHSTDSLIGKIFGGRYRVEATIGKGSMGVVYRARHVLLDRVVALKLILPELLAQKHLRAWMLREARASNRVRHPHVIDIHDIGESEDGLLYLVMEYLAGTTLEAAIASKPIIEERCIALLIQICDALAAAHECVRSAPKPHEREHLAHQLCWAEAISSKL